MFALGSVVTRKTLTLTRGVVAKPTTGAVTALTVTVTLQDISARRTLDKGTIRTTTTKITHTSYVLLSIPHSGVCARGLFSELLLGEANTSLTAGIGADGSLTSNTLVVGKASTLTRATVTVTLVRALNDGMEVIGGLNVAYPGLRLGASAKGAIRSGPGNLAILTVVTGALVVVPAGSMTTAPVGAI